METSNGDTSINIEELASSMKGELDSLITLSSDCCIYRVPNRLRRLNEKAYTPQLVSVGPLHHGKEELRAMEEHKRRYLQKFLQRTEVTLLDFVKLVEERETRLRNCYAEPIGLSSEEFVKMVLIDSAFIIEVLLRYHCKVWRKEIDRIFNKPWTIHDIRLDLWLLENQLPFFILEDILDRANITFPDARNQKLSIIRLTFEFSIDLWDLEDIVEKIEKDQEKLEKGHPSKIQHLVDFLRICHEPPKQISTKLQTLITPSVTELHQAGVKFKLGSSKNLFDIRFNNGVLEIPKLQIVGATELLFRNLLAFERCHCASNYINDYVITINHLINSSNDVELLVRNGIVENWLWDNEGMSDLFHGLVKETSVFVKKFYFGGLVEKLNAHCKRPWHKWQATLKQDYFNNPWATISFIAACILLILTFTQAVCSVLSV